MPSESEITKKFWKSLKSDRTLMLGLAGQEGGDSQPMTALVDGDAETGPLWIFTSKDTDLAKAIKGQHDAVAQFASKGHDVFAALHGSLSLDNDRAVIDRLWSPFVAAWFKGGKDDPKLQLLRFDLDHVHVWLNENSVFAGIRLMLGHDPKKDYKDKVADVKV